MVVWGDQGNGAQDGLRYLQGTLSCRWPNSVDSNRKHRRSELSPSVDFGLDIRIVSSCHIVLNPQCINLGCNGEPTADVTSA